MGMLFTSVAAASAVAAMALGATSASASSSPTPIRPQTAVAESHTDVSKLNIIHVSAEEMRKNSVPAGIRPKDRARTLATTPSLASGTVEVSCGSRIDWYRIIGDNLNNYRTRCFSWAGHLDISTTAIKTLCPGNNTGRVLWTYGTSPFERYYWSTWRSGYSNYNTCYSFDQTVYVDAVELKA